MDWHGNTTDQAWDTELFAGGGHFLQSSHWAAFNKALGKRVFAAKGEGWQCLAILEVARTGKRLYCPYGPLAKDKKSFKDALINLTQLAHGHGAFFVRMEPIVPIRQAKLADFNVKPALKNIQPAQTWVQDLTKTTGQLLADFTATNRNLYNNASTKGLSFRGSDQPKEMKTFLKMIHDVAAHTGIKPHSDSYYQTMADVLLPRSAAKLYIAEHLGKPIGAAFVFDSPTTRYYAHAGNLRDARKLHPGAPLLATMLFDAKNQGQKQFDFVGVAPQNTTDDHPWAGFTKFKKSFGGEYKEYLGTWELPTHPLYRLYRGVYQAHKQLRGK
jgi:lipid II:glycine glycyltransferase (peptidoglycan interpeptide bridge formation enzyme)